MSFRHTCYNFTKCVSQCLEAYVSGTFTSSFSFLTSVFCHYTGRKRKHKNSGWAAAGGRWIWTRITDERTKVWSVGWRRLFSLIVGRQPGMKKDDFRNWYPTLRSRLRIMTLAVILPSRWEIKLKHIYLRSCHLKNCSLQDSSSNESLLNERCYFSSCYLNSLLPELKLVNKKHYSTQRHFIKVIYFWFWDWNGG